MELGSRRLIERVPIGIATIGLFYLDVASDVLVAVHLLKHGHAGWAHLILAILAAQYLAAWLALLQWVRAHFRQGADGSMSQGPASILFRLLLLLGLPLGPLTLDVVMILEPLALLELIPHPQYDRFTPVLGAGTLRLLLPAYRATRTALEVGLESLPMLALQAYILWLLIIGGSGYQHPSLQPAASPGSATSLATTTGSASASASTGLPLNLQLLMLSLAASAIHACWVIHATIAAARASGISVRDHLHCLLQMGVDQPLDAIKSDAITEWRSPYHMLDHTNPEAARQLGAALRVNKVSLRRLELGGAGLDDERMQGLCDGLAGSRALGELRTLTLSGNAIGDRGLEALAAVCADGALAALETLTLSGNSISSDGLIALAWCGMGCPGDDSTSPSASGRVDARGNAATAAPARGRGLAELKTLLLANNDICDAGVIALGHAYANGAFPHLLLLHLGGNDAISDDAKRSIEAALAPACAVEFAAF